MATAWNGTAPESPARQLFSGEIKSIGFLPFVLVCAGGNSDGVRSFVACKTQNEVGQFGSELASHAWFSHSKLVRGVDCALQGRTDEAADVLLAWLRGSKGDYEESVEVLQPDDRLVHAAHNYPVFAFDLTEASLGAEQRKLMLHDAFRAYLRADGNNALRYSIIEAFALALSQALDAQQQYEDATAIVASAIAVNPGSIRLKSRGDALRGKTRQERAQQSLEIGPSPQTVGREHALASELGEQPRATTPFANGGDASPSHEVTPIENSLIYVAAMMKAGSTLMWLIASALQEPNGRAAPEKMAGVPHNEFLPLNRDTQKWFPRGGVYKNHAPVSYHTDRFQKETGSKCIIVLRHPADHVAGFYCHQRGIVSVLRSEDAGIPKSRLTPWWLAAGPTRIDQFDPKVPVHQAMEHLISEGYLFKILEWIAEWVRFRNPGLSIIVTYEQLMNDYDGTLDRLSRFIRGEPPNEDVLNYLRHVKASVASEGRDKGKLDKYPFGWTGSIGTWRQYFSFDNACRYNEVVGKFLACHPFASGLLAVYPSPFVDAATVQAPIASPG